jgi:phosphoribosylanthranilate isomerase
MFIKVCGMTSVSAVVAAIECGVDAVGFVFADSPRRVAPALAREMAAQLPRDLLRVAVTRHPTQALLDEVLASFRPDVLQTDAADLATLRVPRTIDVLAVVRDGGPLPDPLPDRVLFESRESGSGTPANWSEAARLAARTRVILAGGLHAGNVAEAIERVRPYGVDVSSGVESAPGVKDARRMAEFVTAVRNACGSRARARAGDELLS